MHMNQRTKPGRLNVCCSYIFLETIIVISFLKTAHSKRKWLYSNKYLFIKVVGTEVEYELLKCLWGAELFFFWQVSVEKQKQHAAKEEKQRVRKELALDQNPNPAGCGTCVSRRVALDVVSEEGFGLPREPGWLFFINWWRLWHNFPLRKKGTFGRDRWCQGAKAMASTWSILWLESTEGISAGKEELSKGGLENMIDSVLLKVNGVSLKMLHKMRGCSGDGFLAESASEDVPSICCKLLSLLCHCGKFAVKKPKRKERVWSSVANCFRLFSMVYYRREAYPTCIVCRYLPDSLALSEPADQVWELMTSLKDSEISRESVIRRAENL